jgi:putative glutamine amidotransferase
MKKIWLPLFLLIILSWSCSNELLKRKPVRLALSSATENYIKWIQRTDSTVQFFDLDSLDIISAIEVLATCDGIILTGGEDVEPYYYGHIQDSAICECNPRRDSLEFALIKKAKKLKIPILGICRGLQIFNVAQGGSLIPDIPSAYPSAVVHRCEDYTKCFHHVKVVENTLLKEICSADTGWVTTNHHQAIARLGEDLKISAYSSDGLPEAIEWTDPKDKGYLMAVQWHPERMKKGNPLSDPIAKTFLQACIIRGVMK